MPKICIKQWFELLIVPVLFLVFVFLIGNWDVSAEPGSAEGRLVGYSGMQQAALYPGEWGFPTYPGDSYTRYPGDEKWDGMYVDLLGYREVQELTVENGVLYAAWKTASVDDDVQYKLLRWYDSDWYPVLDGANVTLDGPVTAIAVDGSKIYIGGDFHMVGGVPVNHVAFWDGTKWNNMSGGISYDLETVVISDILVDHESVYVAGWFSKAGSLTVNNIARWDGTRWHSLNGGVNSRVLALAAVGNQIYAGGDFTMANGAEASHIARWDGQAWHPMGRGTDGKVYSLAVDETHLYVAGSFTQAGDIVARNIALWDGENWNPLGPGIGDWDTYPIDLHTVAVGPEGVYVGGSHEVLTWDYNTYVPDIFAHWNGTAWQSLGSGIRTTHNYYSTYPYYPGDNPYFLNDIAVLGRQVFAGGRFAVAGNNRSTGLAVYNYDPVVGVYSPPDKVLRPGSRVFLVGRFFDGNQPVTVQVNNKVYPDAVTSDDDGKVYLHLQTDPSAMNGFYEVTLTTGTKVASCYFLLGDSGVSWQTDYGGLALDLPTSVQPLPPAALLPIISR